MGWRHLDRSGVEEFLSEPERDEDALWFGGIWSGRAGSRGSVDTDVVCRSRQASSSDFGSVPDVRETLRSTEGQGKLAQRGGRFAVGAREGPQDDQRGRSTHIGGA